MYVCVFFVVVVMVVVVVVVVVMMGDLNRSLPFGLFLWTLLTFRALWALALGVFGAFWTLWVFRALWALALWVLRAS